MAKDLRSQFLDALLQQDQPLSSSAFEEYRAMLDDVMKKAEARVRFRRRFTAGMWITTFSLALVGGLLHLGPIAIRPVGVSLLLMAYGLFWLSLLRLAVYLTTERRSLDTVRNDVRDAMLLELTRKVDALSQRMESFTPTKPTL